MPVDPSKLDSIIGAAEKEYGKGTITRASEQPAIDRIPFDSLELNHITGGGVPRGRRIRLYGPKSSGKSLTCWDIAKNAQKMGLVVCYYDAEKQFTKEFAEAQGVNVDDLILVRGSVIETIGLRMEALMEAAHIHIIDSLTSCISLEELEAGLDEQRVAIKARTWARVLSHIHERFDSSEHTLVMVDQVRAKIGNPKANDEPPGGRYLEHMSDLTLSYNLGGWLFYDKNGNLSDTAPKNKNTISKIIEPDGIEVNVRCVKSRVCRPLRAAKLKMDLNTFDFDVIDEYVKAAKYTGIAEGTSWINLAGEDKSVRPAEFRQRLLDDPSLREQISERLGQNGVPS